MRSFQAVLAMLMAAMVNIAVAAPGIHATVMILAVTLVDTVICSGFPHSVVAAPGYIKAGHTMLTNYTAGCFNASTFPQAGGRNSTLVPWTALASESDPDSEVSVFYTFSTLCKKISATIMTRNIAYNQCEPDSYTNGKYAIMAQMMYLGPHDVFDMRDNYDLCLGAMVLPKGCAYGGLFEQVRLWYNSPNHTEFWNIQARAIHGPCPDCIGGLLV